MGRAFEVVTGRAPVVVHVPHAGLDLPADVAADLRLDPAGLAAEVLAMTDWGTAELAHGLSELGATLLVNRVSRLVVDVERYPDPLEESMEQVGMGAVYTRTSQGAVLRDEDPDRSAAVRADLVARYHTPWHAALTEEVARVVAAHGWCVIVDLHSYPSRPLPYELSPDTPRPEVCLGTDPSATPEAVVELAETVLADHGFATARDTPFAGAITPAAFAADRRVASLMLEVRRDVVCDETTGAPHDGLGSLRSAIGELVAGLAIAHA